MTATGLRRALMVVAVVPTIAGAASMLLGSDVIQDARDVPANVESELRFYATWWLGAGLFLFWVARRVEDRGPQLRAFCALLFLAGCARLLGAAAAGWPDTFFVVLLAFELGLPPLLIAWHARTIAS